MNTSFFLSISLGCISTVAAILCATPAFAQGEQQMPTGYGTGATVQIAGWETDLVRRNKGLEKFHWSAINTVQHYNIVAPGSYQQQRPAAPAKPVTPYHNMKPTVISTWSNPKGPIVDKTYIATADNGSHSNINAHLRGANTGAYGQMGRGYETNSYPQAQYGERSADSRVNARVMHY